MRVVTNSLAVPAAVMGPRLYITCGNSELHDFRVYNLWIWALILHFYQIFFSLTFLMEKENSELGSNSSLSQDLMRTAFIIIKIITILYPISVKCSAYGSMVYINYISLLVLTLYT